jgi:hypothetical protein
MTRRRRDPLSTPMRPLMSYHSDEGQEVDLSAGMPDLVVS